MSAKDTNGWPAWATEAIEIVDYDPRWPAGGEQEKRELQTLLARMCEGEVEHIGSTSVPGLPAKPILDLMARIDSFDHMEEIAAILAPFHWHYVSPELDGREYRRFFVKVREGKRTAHLHLMLPGEPRWERQLSFRDRLRLNPHWKAEYARLKRSLASQFAHDREAYTEAKADFIQRVTGNAFTHFKHKHSRLIDGKRHIWDVEKLWRLAANQPVKQVELARIAELDQNCWFGLGETSAPTIRNVAGHCRRILHADLKYPILFSSDGLLIDGGHRIAKALLQEQSFVDAVYLEAMPAADIVLPEWQS